MWADNLEQPTQRDREGATARPEARRPVQVTESRGTVDDMNPVALLRSAVRKTRIHSGDALLAAEAVAGELEIAERVIDKLRRVNPQLVSAAEEEVWAERAVEDLEE